MKYIYENVLNLIGGTPIVKLNNLGVEGVTILLKLESFNPGGSIKDRIALNMIEAAEISGELKKGDTILEPTSGNTGVGLAMVAAVKGYDLVLTMPDTMSMERRQLLKAYGAKLVLTPGKDGMNGAINKIEELKEVYPNNYVPQQFNNKNNPEAHKKTTAIEIYEQVGNELSIFVSGIGTGGTVTGVGTVLKEKIKDIKIVGIEPMGSPVLSGGKPGPHKIQGIGAGFIPEVLDTNILDEIIQVDNESALNLVGELARKEGLLVGISSAAAVYGAIELAKKKENQGKTILTILPDTGERYLSMGIYDN